MKSFREYLENKSSEFILSEDSNILDEARDKSVPVEFRTSFGVLQRLYNPKQVPDIKELEKDSKTIAKKYKLNADKFFEFAKKRFKEIYGNKIYEYAEDKIEEAAVGQKGRTSYKEAEEYCNSNEDLINEFRKIVKKLGGKTVAKALLDKLSQKPEIKDEIEHISHMVVDNSNY